MRYPEKHEHTDAQSQQWIRGFFVDEELTEDYVIGAGASRKQLRHIEEVHISGGASRLG